MTAGTVVGVVLVVIGTVVMALGTAAVSRANPTERIPYPGNEGFGRYMAAYVIGFFTALMGSFELRDEQGWWALLAGYAVFFVPFLSICLVHGRRRRRLGAR